MPKDSLADILREWEQIHTAMGELDLLGEPALRRKRDEIGAMLAYTRGLADEQVSLTARRQVVTKDLRIAKSQGKDLIVQARGLLRAHLGHRNEALVAFNMRPVRRRSRGAHEADAQPSSALQKALETAGAPAEAVATEPSESGDTPTPDVTKPDAS